MEPTREPELSTNEESVQIVSEPEPIMIKSEGNPKLESKKSLLGKRSRKERANKFIELEAEESDSEQIK